MLNFNGEHFLEQEPEYTSDRRLLLGIDAPLTAATRHVLQTVGEFFAPYSVHMRLLLLNVIPVAYVGGKYTPPGPLPPTTEQRKQAVEALRTACAALQEHGMICSHLETLIRVGSPADELVRVATQQHVDCLVIGSRGHSLGQRLRRVFTGSMSRCVLCQASCPVMVVPLPRSTRSDDLVAWYEAAIRQTLHNHPAALMNLTTADVVGRFPPPDAHNTGRKQRLAAAQALERLACSGLLYRHAATGEMHYLND